MSKQEQNAIVDNYIADNLGQEEEDDDRKYIDDGKGNPKQIKGRYGQPINLKDRNDAINGSRQNDGPSQHWYQSSIDKATDIQGKSQFDYKSQFDIESNQGNKDKMYNELYHKVMLSKQPKNRLETG